MQLFSVPTFSLFQKLLFINENFFSHVFSDYFASYLSKLVFHLGEKQLLPSWILVLAENDVHFPSSVLYTIKVSVLKHRKMAEVIKCIHFKATSSLCSLKSRCTDGAFHICMKRTTPVIKNCGFRKLWGDSLPTPNKSEIRYMLKYGLAPACVNGEHAHTLIFKSCWQKSEISKDLLDRKKGSVSILTGLFTPAKYTFGILQRGLGAVLLLWRSDFHSYGPFDCIKTQKTTNGVLLQIRLMITDTMQTSLLLSYYEYVLCNL